MAALLVALRSIALRFVPQSIISRLRLLVYFSFAWNSLNSLSIFSGSFSDSIASLWILSHSIACLDPFWQSGSFLIALLLLKSFSATSVRVTNLTVLSGSFPILFTYKSSFDSILNYFWEYYLSDSFLTVHLYFSHLFSESNLDILLLNTNNKSYMDSLVTPLDMTLSIWLWKMIYIPSISLKGVGKTYMKSHIRSLTTW